MLRTALTPRCRLAITLLCLSFTSLSTAYSAKSVDTYDFGLTRPVISADPFRTNYSIKTRVYETLADFGLSGTSYEDLTPKLAKSWQLSEDRKQLTVELREDVLWHDGKGMTSEDIKFSWELYSMEEFKSYKLYFNQYSTIENIEILGKYKVRFHLKDTKYESPKVVLAAFRIFPKHVYLNSTKADRKKTMIGSGPYKFKRFQKGKRIILEKFKDWWGANDPYWSRTQQMEEISFRYSAETVVAIQKIRQRQLDAHPISSLADMKLAEDAVKDEPEKFKIVEGESKYGVVIKLYINLGNEKFKDKRIREALNLVWDRKEINKQLYRDRYTPSQGMFMKGVPFAGKQPNYSYDPMRAIELFNEAGWKDSNKDGLLDRTVNGKRENFEFTITTAFEDLSPLLTTYQEAAKKLGITVKIKMIDRTSIIDTIYEHRYEVFAMHRTGQTYIPPVGNLVSGNKFNITDLRSPEVDTLFAKLDHTYDEKERLKIARKMQEIVDGEITQIDAFETKKYHYVTSTRTIVPKSSRERSEWRYWGVEPKVTARK